VQLLLAINWVTAIPYLVAFGAVTIVPFVIGKIPGRGNKLMLLPWLEGGCSCLTLLIGIGLLRVLGLREEVSILWAAVAWVIIYFERSSPIVRWLRPVTGLLVAWALYRLW
jgi:hypothetical protein